MEPLLTELTWLRQLAHHLTRDESQADDLVQEAFMVARERPPRPGAPLRPWLFRVMQNLFRMRRRGEGRRQRRELGSDAPLPHQSAEDALESLEAHRALTDALERLEEPFRSTLLLHYYEGLTAVAIARRQGVPPGTVRWRLMTARERLRADLDRRYERREAWLAILVPFAANPLPPKGDGMITLAKPLLVVAALGAVVIGGVTKWKHAAPSSRSPSQAAASAGTDTTAPKTRAPVKTAYFTPAPVGAPAPGAVNDDDLPVVGVTNVGLSEDAQRRISSCLVGVAHREGGSLTIDLTVDDRVIRKATIRNADRGLPELSDPAVERCVLDALQGATVDALERVVYVIVYPRSARTGTERLRAPHTRADLEGLPSVGPDDAGVVLVEYADFQCPFSARAVPMMSELAARYPSKLRIVFRQLPLPFHENAALAAEASLAAHAQGKFWPMHDVLFRHADKLDRASLSGYASEAGLDVAAFDEALDSHRFQAAVARDVDSASQFAIQATPLVSINGRIVVGARPVGEYLSIVEQEIVAPTSGRPVAAASSGPGAAPSTGTPATVAVSTTEAEAAYHERQYSRCAELWLAFAGAHNSGAASLGFFNAACCLALDGKADSAVATLERAIAAGFREVDFARTDADLDSLRSHPRWPALMAALNEVNEKSRENVGDPALRRELLAMVREDPAALRAMLGGGAPSRQLIDGRKTARLKEILTSRGWPTEIMVGSDGQWAASVLVMHADGDRPLQKLGIEKLEAAVKAGRARASSLAYLSDRVAVLENRKQTWGTHFVGSDPSPIDDEEHVDERRKQVGLPSMAEYRKQRETYAKSR